MTEWKQERPSWCPHPTCQFRRRAMDSLCGGALPAEVRETDEFDQLHINDLRICLNETHQPPPHAKPIDLKVNPSDLDWFRYVLDALDGKKTSWLSKKGTSQETVLPRLEALKKEFISLRERLKGTKYEEGMMSMVVDLANIVNSLTETRRYEKPEG